MNQLISLSLPSSGASSIIDFNWNHVHRNADIIIQSTKAINVEVSDGPAGADSNEVRTLGTPVPYSSGGNPNAILDGSPTTYSVLADTNKKILIKHDEVGECVRFKFISTTASAATVTVSASL